MPRQFARDFFLDDYGREVPPLIVTKQVLKIASKPEFNTVFCLLCMSFKGVGKGMNDLSFHGQPFSPRRPREFATGDAQSRSQPHSCCTHFDVDGAPRDALPVHDAVDALFAKAALQGGMK